MHGHSWLFTPGTRAERFAKAADCGADVLIIDLEDAVAPGDKARARAAALAYAASPRGLRLAVRINGIDTLAGLVDLQALCGGAPAFDYLVLPKAESAAHVRIVDSLLAEAGCAAGLVALIETARGLAAVDEIAMAGPRLAALMFGAADMAADFGADAAWGPLLHARGRIVTACALAGIAAIDSPYFAIQDTQGLTQETQAAAAMGFAAKAAIHPEQVAAINAVLTPSPAEVENARQIMSACEAGAAQVNGRMVDAAMARHARRVLANAGRERKEGLLF